MTEEEALRILGAEWREKEGVRKLADDAWNYISWYPQSGSTVVLDGDFSLEQLRALVFLMEQEQAEGA